MSKINYRSQFSYSFAGQAVVIRAKVSIAAAGAPTIVAGTGMGIQSITRNSAGDYSILLSNPFFALLDARVSIDSGASAPAAPFMNIEADTTTSVAAPTLRVQFRDIAAAAADPASGEVLHLSLEFNRSSTGY